MTKPIWLILCIAALVINTSSVYWLPGWEPVLKETYCGAKWGEMLLYKVTSFVFVVGSYWAGIQFVDKFSSIDGKKYPLDFLFKLYLIQVFHAFLCIYLISYFFNELKVLILLLLYAYYPIEILYLSRNSFKDLGLFKSISIFSVFSLVMALYLNLIESAAEFLGLFCLG